MGPFPFATAERFTSLLENPDMARFWLAGLGVRDAERGFRDLRDLAESGLPLHLVARLAGQLDAALPRCPDPGMALTNLERFVAASPTPEATLDALANSARGAEIAVQLFSTSQFFSELMIRDPACSTGSAAGPTAATGDLADRRPLGRAGTSRRRRGPTAGPPAVPAPRDPPDRLQRHRPRPAARTDHARPLAPGRRLRRGRPTGWPGGTPRPATAPPAEAETAGPPGSSCWRSASSAARS